MSISNCKWGNVRWTVPNLLLFGQKLSLLLHSAWQEGEQTHHFKYSVFSTEYNPLHVLQCCCLHCTGDITRRTLYKYSPFTKCERSQSEVNRSSPKLGVVWQWAVKARTSVAKSGAEIRRDESHQEKLCCQHRWRASNSPTVIKTWKIKTSTWKYWNERKFLSFVLQIHRLCVSRFLCDRAEHPDPGWRKAAQTWPRDPWKCITYKHTYRKKNCCISLVRSFWK